MNDNRFGVILVTIGNKKEAMKMAKKLIEENLAACVNCLPITSVYRWQEKICQDSEWQLIIKTDLQLFCTLENRIKELHSYEVPEIIAIPIIKASQPYLNWIEENVIKS
ncbi:periplasmic divalent cation tolerance protein cutA [Geminocystis sp. NIES-3708]|uniref:divalent-cation tolerance protein CutA n=1 Tax=Geminocystis sp. NIES-3708 TaxID=1615909 RepID=UPI0005FC74F9|nr:divalent-cation tolerance protein CutA [Geminocystis sp. NIES-3708]BAQ62723.1 periplasmic divalent cation tolerance protein cutA [Geminocystis sp. NIES-3708]